MLDAEVMCLRQPGSPCWTVPAGLTFRSWLRGPEADRPTADDLSYHMSTLFPPVRPRGHLELRVIDAQPGDGWVVPAALVTALLDDPVAAQAAMVAVQPLWQGTPHEPRGSGPGQINGHGRPLVNGPWLRAARRALDDPQLARASQECFAVADTALGRPVPPRPSARRSPPTPTATCCGPGARLMTGWTKYAASAGQALTCPTPTSPTPR